MQVISYQRLIPTIDGGAKVLFDQIEGKDLEKERLMRYEYIDDRN